MVMTEQGAFLDGHDVPANHEAGWNQMLDNLAASYESAHSPASRVIDDRDDGRLGCRSHERGKR